MLVRVETHVFVVVYQYSKEFVVTQPVQDMLDVGACTVTIIDEEGRI